VAIHELLYMLGKLVKKPLEKKVQLNLEVMHTQSGVFKVRSGTNDITCVSPSFERPDLEYLKKLIVNKKLDTFETAFLDIGADIGLYSVLIGNITSQLDIYAFEPNASTLLILEENINLNKGKNRTEICKFALGSKNETLQMNFNESNPGSSTLTKIDSSLKKISVPVKRLDESGLSFSNYKNLIIKIDVEGFEQQVLEGALSVLKYKNVYLVIEDFISTQIVDYLQKNKFTFMDKRTPYNSWWHKEVE
jgi:FkbM family methyltransferase